MIGATNRPDILDKALLRSGRFDRRIRVPHLSGKDRLEVLKIHTRNKKLKEDISLENIADMSEGCSGAELENLVNEAALLAVRRARAANALPLLEMADFKESFKPSWSGDRFFDSLDAVLVESASQLAEPAGKALARLHLRDNIVLEGEVLWADAFWIKIRHNTGPPLDTRKKESIVPKIQIIRMEALEGTEKAEDLLPDPWIGRHPDLA